jgi:Cdc6-like AAA superfamily ATPase
MNKLIKPSKNFMFREQEIARVRDIWEQGQSVLLVGIRRIGKSQLMKAALAKQLEQPGGAVYIDAEDFNQLHQLYQSLLDAMPKSLQSKLHDLLKHGQRVPEALLGWIARHVKKISIPGMEGGIELNSPEAQLERYWEPIAQALIELVQNHASAEPLPVIGIDELPFMIEHLLEAQLPAKDITMALASLRKLRDAGLRMIVGGSISLENQLTLLKIPSTVLGGLKRQPVPPFTRAEAKLYLSHHLKNRPVGTDEAIEVLLNWLPDYIPQFLEDTVLDARQLTRVEDLADCLEDKVMPAVRKGFLTQFDERLAKNYTEAEAVAAQTILDSIASANQRGGRINSRQFPASARGVLVKLQHDMFIEEAPDFGYRFTLNLLRQWWCSTRGIDAAGNQE